MKNKFSFYYEKVEIINFLQEQIDKEIFQNTIYDESEIENLYNNLKQAAEVSIGNAKKIGTNIKMAWDMGNREKSFINFFIRLNADAENEYENISEVPKETLSEMFNNSPQLIKTFARNIEALKKEYRGRFQSFVNTSGQSGEFAKREAMKKTVELFLKNGRKRVDEVDRFTISSIVDLIDSSITTANFDTDVMSSYIKANSGKKEESQEEDNRPINYEKSANKLQLKQSIVDFINSDAAKNPRINGQLLGMMKMAQKIIKNAKDPNMVINTLRIVNKNFKRLMKDAIVRSKNNT